MLRHITVILLLFAFGAQTFQSTFLVLDYYYNTGSFAKNCENRFRPMMHCNGRCLLMKKFREQENKEQRNPERKQENKNEAVSPEAFFAPAVIDACLNDLFTYADRKEHRLIKRPRSFFRPPDRNVLS